MENKIDIWRTSQKKETFFTQTYKINKILKVNVQRTSIVQHYCYFSTSFFHKKQKENHVSTED